MICLKAHVGFKILRNLYHNVTTLSNWRSIWSIAQLDVLEQLENLDILTFCRIRKNPTAVLIIELSIALKCLIKKKKAL